MKRVHRISDAELVHPISPSLLCPICKEVCFQPVISHSCHHSFCAGCIADAVVTTPLPLHPSDKNLVSNFIRSIYSDDPFLDRSFIPQIQSQCPLCRAPLFPRDLHPNLALAALTNELQVFCSNRAFGCFETFTFETKASHEKLCTFTPTTCRYSKYGCTFCGTKDMVENHMLHDCRWESFKQYIEYNEKEMSLFKETMEQQRIEIQMLKKTLEHLTTGNSNPIHPVSSFSSSTIPPSTAPSCSQTPVPKPESWAFQDIKCQLTLTGHARGVTSLVYDFERNVIFSGSHDGSLKIWDVAARECTATLHAHLNTIWGLGIDEQNHLLYSGGAEGVIKIWDYHQLSRSEVDVSPSASAHDLNSLYEKLYVGSLEGHSGRIYDILFHQGALFSASVDRTIRIWNPTQRECVHTLCGHTEGVNAVSVVGGYLATASSDKTVRIWDLVQGRCFKTLEQSSSDVLAVCSSEDFLFCATQSAEIQVYDTREFKLLETLTGHRWEVWQLACADNVALFSGSFDHTLKRWDTRSWSCTDTLYGHKGYIHAISLARHALLTAGGDRTIKLWAPS